jgi:hypothetical protein
MTMHKINYFLLVSVLSVTVHAMDVEPNRAAEEQIKQLMDLKDDGVNWVDEGEKITRLLNGCDPVSMGRLLHYAMAHEQDHYGYHVWMLNIVSHLCDEPDTLLANLKQLFAAPDFRLNDAASHTLLTFLGKGNFTDSTAVFCIQYLLKHGVNINCTNEDGETPLMYYVGVDRFFLAEYLITRGADAKMAAHLINSVPHGVKTTPTLHFAGSARMVQLLLTKGKADKNVRDYRGNTLLHLFTDQSDTIHVPGLLIQHSADINVQNNEGNTPLHCAVKQGNQNIIRLLTRCGADCRIKNNAGELPINIELLPFQASEMTAIGVMHDKN